ncbi:MAG: ORF6N domain-containing protein [Clostridiales bacterium]|nr:ORF6N domain-containing protein [Clostridiales bacterium]
MKRMILGIIIIFIAVTFLWAVLGRTKIPEDASGWLAYPYRENGEMQVDIRPLSEADTERLRQLLDGCFLFPNLTLLGENQRFLDSYYFEFSTEEGKSMRFYIPRSGQVGSFAYNLYLCFDIGPDVGLEIMDMRAKYMFHQPEYR